MHSAGSKKGAKNEADRQVLIELGVKWEQEREQRDNYA